MALTKVKAGNILLTTPSASSNDVTPATTQYVTTALANMVDSAPSTLNTLNELAAALGDDANFSTTVTTSIATKAPLNGPTFTGTITGPHIVSTSNTATQFKNATDTDIQHKLETNAGADFAIHRLIGSDGVDNKFIIGYGPNHGSTPNQVALKATHASGTIGLYTGASSTNALTIDSSQDATFSSDVNIAGTTKLDGGNGYFRDTVGNSFSSGWDSNSDDHSTWINFEGYQGGTTKFRDLRIGNGKQTAFVHFDGSASTSNFSGNIYLTGSNDRRIKLSDSGIGGVSDSNNTVHIRGDNDNMKLMAAGNGGFIFEENGTERMRILSGGAGVVLDGGLSTFADSEGDNLQLGTGSGDTGMTFYSGSDGRSSIYFGNNGTNGNVDGAIKYFHESYSTASVRRGIGIITGNATRGFLSNSAGQLIWGHNAASTPNYPGTITAHRTGDSSSTTQNTWSFNGNANGYDRDYGFKVTGTGAYAYGVINTGETTWMSRLDFAGAIHLTNTTVQNISDRRLKKDIVDANSQWNDIKALQFKNYKWINPERGSDTYLGLIADEVESVSPGLVGIDAISAETMPDDGIDPEYKNVKYSIVWMKAVKALQEAMTKIETLETELDAAKARITTLEQ